MNLRFPQRAYLPAFGLPHDLLANQCKCRRRPSPKLAFQRAQTTSRALNKCRCDRPETRGGLPLRHAPPSGSGRDTRSRALAVCAARRGKCPGGMGCAPSNSGGNGGPQVEGQRGDGVSPLALDFLSPAASFLNGRRVLATGPSLQGKPRTWLAGRLGRLRSCRAGPDSPATPASLELLPTPRGNTSCPP